MNADEQLTTTLEPLGGFVISGSWPRSIPARLTGLEEFLAQSPIPTEARPLSDESDDTPRTAVSPALAIGAEASQAAPSRLARDEDWNAVSAIVAGRPFVDEEVLGASPIPRAIAAEAAALAVVEPRALVAPSDVLIETTDRIPNTDNRDLDESGEVLHALIDAGGLVDPSPWFSSGMESNPSRESAAAPGFGFHSSESPTASARFDRRGPDDGREGGPASFSRADRRVDSSPESFEEVEARLSRVAATLEEIVGRIGATASEPLRARAGGFRGRVDE